MEPWVESLWRSSDQTVLANQVSREERPSPVSNWLQLQPFLDGQSIVVSELGPRRSGDQFPKEKESDLGHVPVVVSSGLVACA